MELRYIHYKTIGAYQNRSWEIANVGCLLLMRVRILSNKKTSQGILRAPLYSYPNSCAEASNNSANSWWLRALASITNLIGISFPTYTGRHPLETILSFFLPSEFFLLLSFFCILTKANGRIEERIWVTLCSKRINWHILDEISKRPDFARFSKAREYMAYNPKPLLIRNNTENLSERVSTGSPNELKKVSKDT